MKTVIAAFTDPRNAQQALDALHARNIEQTSIELIDESMDPRADMLEAKGVPHDRAELYAEGVHRGSALVVVDVPDREAEDIASLLDEQGSIDLELAATQWGQSGWRGYQPHAESERDDTITDPGITSEDTDLGTRPAMSSSTATGRDETLTDAQGDLDGDSFAAVEEQVKIGKREVQRGGVRVRAIVTERPVRETVMLHEERVDVQREHLDEPISVAEADKLFTEDEFVVTAKGEEAVVEKQARVVERVRVEKTEESRPETIEETERRRDIDVEQLDKDRGRR